MKKYNLEVVNAKTLSFNDKTINQSSFTAYVNRENDASHRDGAVIWALYQVSGTMHNSERLNRLLASDAARYKNKTLKQLGQQYMDYFLVALDGIIEKRKSDTSQLQLKKDRDPLALETMLERAGLFSEYQEKIAQEKEAKKNESEKKKHAEKVVLDRLKNDAKAADLEAKEAQEKADIAGAPLAAIEKANELQALAEEKQSLVVAHHQASLEKKGSISFASLKRTLEQAIYGGIELDSNELAELLKLTSKLDIRAAQDAAANIVPDVSTLGDEKACGSAQGGAA